MKWKTAVMIRRRAGAVPPPPPYVQLSSHFISLESAAEAFGNRDASFYLQKTRMSLVKGYASEPVQQADMRRF